MGLKRPHAVAHDNFVEGYENAFVRFAVEKEKEKSFDMGRTSRKSCGAFNIYDIHRFTFTVQKERQNKNNDLFCF